ncbi:hypothetical protein ACFWMG_15460 [Streptomyces sp. NPDC127074]|uniref:hypothetical protein n=1 Tax=Streptomyces sp. NPDC127074 TaxID=3347130 RepID=UPI0036537A27
MTTNPASLSREYEAEIRERLDRLNDDRVMTGSTWLASSVGPKSVFPPEQSHVVEDVLETKHSVIRGSVGVFGDKQHAEFTAHAPDDVAALLDEIDRLRAERHTTNAKLAERDVALKAAKKRVAELEAAASAGLKSLSSFIFDTTDPGVDALGAQWLLGQAMPQVDDPFAEPNRYRDEILRQAAKRQRDFIVSDDYVCDDWEAALDVADLIDPDEQTATSEGGA